MEDKIKITIKREGTDNPFDAGKFDNKMTNEQRCFALCLHIRGESWRLIAAYFNAHYRTVQMIKTGPRYKSVRSEFNKLGQDDFVAKYETEAALADFKKFKEDNGEELFANRQHADPDKPGWSPRKNATGSKGQHERTSLLDGSQVFFDILWRDANDNMKPGWYVFSRGGKDGPYGTSGIAFDAARQLWDPAVSVAETVPADETEVEATRLFEAAKNARVAMELNPSSETYDAFVNAAYAVYRFVDKNEGLPEPSVSAMFARIDWRGFDHTPYHE